MCKSAYYSIKALRYISLVLTCDRVRAVAGSLTQTRLYLANSVLIGTSASNINKLQRVQNCLARVVLKYNNNSATSLLSELRWLPVKKFINFKTATLAYQVTCFWSAHLSVFGINTSLTRICYLCHAATAVSDKEVFPTASLKSGMSRMTYLL